MLTIHKCLKCGNEFPAGGFIAEPLPKCPHCGSRLTRPKL